nr:DUF4244 domain-containing protein [Glycomyces tenuis]
MTATDSNPTAATRLDLKPKGAERCASACRLKARCRLDGPGGTDCPAKNRPAETDRTEPAPPKNTAYQPQPNRRRPRPKEDEWSPGRMKGVTKPSWGGKFASKMRGESGMSTAEYAVGTLAAVAFAGVLLKVLTSGTVQSALTDLIERALS